MAGEYPRTQTWLRNSDPSKEWQCVFREGWEGTLDQVNKAKTHPFPAHTPRPTPPWCDLALFHELPCNFNWIEKHQNIHIMD